MSGTKKPWHSGPHKRIARALCTTWAADPNTRCQATNCKGWGNRTLAEHPHTKTGKPPRWEAGHVNAGQIGGPYRPEVDVCNRADGARLINATRKPDPHSVEW